VKKQGKKEPLYGGGGEGKKRNSQGAVKSGCSTKQKKTTILSSQGNASEIQQGKRKEGFNYREKKSGGSFARQQEQLRTTLRMPLKSKFCSADPKKV